MDIKKQLNNAFETGKVLMGSKKTIDSILNDEPKLVILSSNCPAKSKESIEYYARLADVMVVVLKDNGVELGSSLGRSHSVSALSVLDEGESSILEVKK